MKKTVLTFSVACIAMVMIFTSCGRGTTIKKSVSYQGDIMRIEVYAKVNGRKVQDFKKEYNVAGLDKSEREAMSKRIIDSLNIPDNAGK